jgi:putative flippase GtrA
MRLRASSFTHTLYRAVRLVGSQQAHWTSRFQLRGFLRLYLERPRQNDHRSCGVRSATGTVPWPSWFKRAVTAHPQFLLYLVIGGSATGIDVAVYAVLTAIADTSPLIANTISVGIAIVYSYLINAFLNFRVRDRLFLRLVSFVVVCVGGYFISTTMIWFLTDVWLLGPLISKVLTLPVVIVFQYCLNKRVTFGVARPAASPDDIIV